PEATISITFSRAANNQGSISLMVNAGALLYGVDSDYFTEPAEVNSRITLPYIAGEESVSFVVKKGSGLNIQQDENISFSLEEDPSLFITGNNLTSTVSFSENFIAPSGTLELNAGGEGFTQKAFVDLSKLQQINVSTQSWDLGFATEAGVQKVVLNSAAFVMARSLDKSNLDQVNEEDTLGFAATMAIPQFDPSVGASAWVDHPSGDLSRTAFGGISNNAANAKVFIIKRNGENRNWKKVKVYSQGEDYVVEHADIAATDFASTTINKDAAFNFNFLDLDNGEVSVEPEREVWDIMYGTYTELLNLGGPGLDIPYGFKDFIITNRTGVSVAMVLEENIAYADFASSDIAVLEFNTEIDAIGENWRSGGGPNSGPALHTDRFFVIQDGEGNYFKLLFTRLTSTDGERGKPEFTFERIQ
ncbi:MAG: hypothetical protein F6K11_31100, partial [Leptolyngbya sp. SIO3F4]|nr:hypothetical protein [Leptolyngbya sp. SIO3F4]